MQRIRVILGALAIALVTSTEAQAENVLRWTSGTGVTSWEPTNGDTPSFVSRDQVYEGLTVADADLSIHPGLATSWTLVRPDTWRFEVRQGVHFQDGTPLTPEDIVFSLRRAGAEGSEMAYFAKEIVGIAVVDGQSVEITTGRPELRMPVQSRVLAVLSKSWAERHGAELPAGRGGDPSAYILNHANGTGPFALESFEREGRTVLVRSPNWWGLEQYPHNIDRIVWTPERDPERRLAMLLNDEVDFLQDPPLAHLDRLRGVSGIKLAQASSLLTIILGADQHSAELRTSDVKGRNPFADRRVRQALYQAIDIEQLVKTALGGLAVPAGMVEAPGVNGYDPELDRRLPYDRERAKALLAEAGYPDGFAVRLDCPELRREPCPELGAQFAGVGLRVTVDVEPFDVFKSRVATRATDLYVLAEGSGFTFDSAEPLREVYTDTYWLGATGYANPAFDILLDQIDRELSTMIRDALLEQAWRIVLDDIVVVPLYHPLQVWAMRDRLDLPIGSYIIPVFRQAHLTVPPAH